MSQSDDPYEREADQMAESVVSGSGSGGGAFAPGRSSTPQRITPRVGGGQVLRQSIASGGESTGHNPGEIDGASESRIRGLSGGMPLSDGQRDYYESKIGQDFSNVRLHTDARAQTATQSIGARALTHGNDIAFAPGELQPESIEGRKLLAHELTHVAQQSGSAGAAGSSSAGAARSSSAGAAGSGGVSRKVDSDVVHRMPSDGDSADAGGDSADSQTADSADNAAASAGGSEQEALVVRLVDIMKSGGIGSPAVQEFLANLDPKIAESVLQAASARFRESGGDQSDSASDAGDTTASDSGDATSPTTDSAGAGTPDAADPLTSPTATAGADKTDAKSATDAGNKSGSGSDTDAQAKIKDAGDSQSVANDLAAKSPAADTPAASPKPAAAPAADQNDQSPDEPSGKDAGRDGAPAPAKEQQTAANPNTGDGGAPAPAGAPTPGGGDGQAGTPDGGGGQPAPQISTRDGDGEPAAKDGEPGQDPAQSEPGGNAGAPVGSGGDDAGQADSSPVVAPAVDGKAQVHLDAFASGVNRQKSNIQQALGQSHAAADRKGKEQKARVRQVVQEKKQSVGGDLDQKAQSREQQSEQQRVELEAHAEQQKERIAGRYSAERERLDAIFAARRKEIQRSAAARRQEVRGAERNSIKAVQAMTKRHVREAMAYADRVEAQYQNAGFGKPTTIGLMSHRFARSTASELKAFQPKAISQIENEADQAVEKLEDNEAKQLERLEEQYDKSVEALGEVRNRANSKLDEAMSGLLPRLRDAGRRMLRFLTDTKALLVSGLDRLSGSYEEKTDRAVAKSKQALTQGANDQLLEMDEATAGVFEHADDFDHGDDAQVAALFAELNTDVETGGAKASEQILASPIKIGDEVTWGGDLAADAVEKLSTQLNEIVNSSDSESGDGIQNIDVSSKEGISKVGDNSVQKLGDVTAAFNSSSKELARKADAAFGKQAAKAKERFTAIEKDTHNKQREALRVSKREIDKEASKIANSSLLGTAGSFAFQIGANVLNFLAGLIVGILITLAVAIIAIVAVIAVVALAKVIAAALALAGMAALIAKLVVFAIAAIVVLYGLYQAGAMILENLRAVFTNDSLTAYERGKLLGESLAEIVLFLLPFAKGRVRLPAVLGRRLSRFLARGRGLVRRNITRPASRKFENFLRNTRSRSRRFFKGFQRDRSRRLQERRTQRQQRREEKIPEQQVREDSLVDVVGPRGSLKLSKDGTVYWCSSPCEQGLIMLRKMFKENSGHKEITDRIRLHRRRLLRLQAIYKRDKDPDAIVPRMKALRIKIQETRAMVNRVQRQQPPVSRADLREIPAAVTTRMGLKIDVEPVQLDHAIEAHTIHNFDPVKRWAEILASRKTKDGRTRFGTTTTSFLKPGQGQNRQELATIIQQILTGKAGRSIVANPPGGRQTVNVKHRGSQYLIAVGIKSGGGLKLLTVFVKTPGRQLSLAEVARMARQVNSGAKTRDQIRAELLRRFSGK
ncbi:MAG: DUF4157 domain-containing protein [bacterium]|nr:DUF4157 domain-containing protein [bacterium]